MRTTKPISTISYNSLSFLEVKLSELLKAGRISFWAFIPHLAEDDEGGCKDHIHVFVVPSKMLQTDDLKKELTEFDPRNPSKPLGCISWRSSKFDDWYMYGLHDSAYLVSKGQQRRHKYVHSSFFSSDSDELLFLARSIDRLSLSRYADMQDAILNGISWPEYFSRGTIPIQQVRCFQNAWELLQQNITVRREQVANGDIDPHTGELLEFPRGEK